MKAESNSFSFFISGRIPSKKNSRCLFVRGGRLVNIPSAKYSAWHKDAMLQIAAVAKKHVPMSNINIVLDFLAPDKRASDLTNKAESIMDLLVDAGILVDDNWWVLNKIVLNFKGVDKVKPGCSVQITENVT